MFSKLIDAVSWIEMQLKFKPKSDLDRMKFAYQMLDIDLSHVKKIHVAGTNGKGSVCAYLSNILTLSGYKVGTFTSPYLIVFNERIKFQFENISDDDLLEVINQIVIFNEKFEQIYGENLSFFELLTLMSLIYFKKMDVNVIVMEVGLGGLLDATNVMSYDVSLITSIGFDHMKQLGYTLESIAFNKLGILKEGNHLITTVDPKLHEQFITHAKSLSSTYELYTVDDLTPLSSNPLTFSFDNYIYTPALLGDYQMLNALLAIQATHYLFPEITNDVINLGLSKTLWPGRLEEISDKVYVDGAHNVHAIEALSKLATTTFKDKEILVLFSSLGDKDIPLMLAKLGEFAKRVILTSFPDLRYKDLSIYATDSMSYIDNSHQALSKLRKDLKENEILLVTGSLHFIGYIKSLL